MPTATESQMLTFKDWTFRLRMTQTKPDRLIILTHGWMGDGNSMWVLAQKLSQKYTILAPRGPFPVTEGGFSWRKIKPGTWGTSSLEDLRPAVETLLTFVDDWSASAGKNVGKFDVMGFSQGEAMVYALTLLYPERIRRLAALSGFIPDNGDALFAMQRLSGKPVLIAHGRQDDLIPVENARRAVSLLKRAGAQVNYCESDTCHKLSMDYLNAMEKFFGDF